mmetsp:Transcript_35104/g.83847  ORF Transcript_35104/g.83847 Transcript_35104/m.83847 type:complete len:449 (+) Transcript_35104:7-1353(+)
MRSLSTRCCTYVPTLYKFKRLGVSALCVLCLCKSPKLSYTSPKLSLKIRHPSPSLLRRGSLDVPNQTSLLERPDEGQVEHIVALPPGQHRPHVMVVVIALARHRREHGTDEVEQRECREGELPYPVRHLPHEPGLLPVGRLAGTFGVPSGRVVHEVEPQGPRLAEPDGRVRYEEADASEVTVRQDHLGQAHREGERVEHPQRERVVVPRDELLLHGPVPLEEAERLLVPVEERRVRVAGNVAVLVVAAVLAGPPDGPALVGGAAEDVEKEADGGGALERGVGRVAVEADGHAHSSSPYPERHGRRDGHPCARPERPRHDQQRRHVDRSHDQAERRPHPLEREGVEHLERQQDAEDRAGVDVTQNERPVIAGVAGRGGGEEDGGRDEDVDPHPYLVHVEASPGVPRPRRRRGELRGTRCANGPRGVDGDDWDDRPSGPGERSCGGIVGS